ncbi:MAG: aminotransferase class V-fold PLP-dependent enzyme, partial [Bacteroidales bacterium]|nr:aminotransferase class V-fold PLP-dependent enzyme [Bacteroidales bacterium]
MNLNGLDNFLANAPTLGTVPQVAVPNEAPDELDLSALPRPDGVSLPTGGGGGGVPAIGGLSAADAELFRGVIAKYFAEDVALANVPADQKDDVAPPKRDCIFKDDGFGIGIPETELVRNLRYDEADTLNTTEIRKQFPILDQKVNGHDLVWFDNGATTQKPLRVIDGIAHFYKTDYSNIHRGAHTLAARSTDQYEGAREKVARFINASAKENILFVRGTTEGINLVAQTFGHKFLEEGDNVIVSTLDHHANIVPWQQICKERKAELRAIPIDRNGDLILSELERLISPRTK